MTSGSVSVSVSPPSGTCHTRIFASSPANQERDGRTHHITCYEDRQRAVRRASSCKYPHLSSTRIHSPTASWCVSKGSQEKSTTFTEFWMVGMDVSGSLPGWERWGEKKFNFKRGEKNWQPRLFNMTSATFGLIFSCCHTSRMAIWPPEIARGTATRWLLAQNPSLSPGVVRLRPRRLVMCVSRCITAPWMWRNLEVGPESQMIQQRMIIIKWQTPWWTMRSSVRSCVHTQQVLDGLGALAGTGAGEEARGEAWGGGGRAGRGSTAAGSAQRTTGGGAATRRILKGSRVAVSLSQY